MSPAGRRRVSLGLALLLGGLACGICVTLTVLLEPNRGSDASAEPSRYETPLQQVQGLAVRQRSASPRVLDMCRRGELPATGRLCLEAFEVERRRFLAPAGPYHPTPLAAFWSLGKDPDPTDDAAERPRMKVSAP